MNPKPSVTVSLQEKDSKLSLAWTNKQNPLFGMLSSATVIEYFSDPENKFYDPNCNNETLRMQRMSMDNLRNMVGVEFVLADAQEPILFVIKKQYRRSPNDVVPLATFYVLAGTVYQAPDLWSVINSRLLNTSHFISSAASEMTNYVRYHPSVGYHWDIKPPNSANGSVAFVPSDPYRKAPEETGTQFQRKNVDSLLAYMTQKFPFKPMPAQHPFGPRVQQEPSNPVQNGGNAAVQNGAVESKDQIVKK